MFHGPIITENWILIRASVLWKIPTPYSPFPIPYILHITDMENSVKLPSFFRRGGLFFFLSCVFLSSCAASARSPESQYLLGTICTVNLFDQGRPELYSRVFARIRELEDILSANLEGTDLDRVNQNAGLGPVKVRPELIEVLSKALDYAEKSKGFFDPSVGPLVKLWGIGTEGPRVPGEQEIASVLDLVDYREIEINREEETVFLRRQGMALDLGAIAKGYAADEAVRLLRREGVERAIIDLGGDIFVLGERRSERAGNTDNEETYWRIGIQDPRGNRGMYIGILKAKNASIVSSGNYERFFEEAGKRYHHIFSTKSGFPAENGLLSVTIVADNCIDADALSTAAFALGWEQGRDLIALVPGAEGLFVFDDLSLRLTGDLEEYFTLTAMEYRLVE